MSRLNKVGLTQKDANGAHHLTLYGNLVVRQLKGLEFTSKQQNYFKTHSITHLPPEFISRIDELANSRYVSDISVAIVNVERVIREAEEYIRTISDHYLANTLPLFSQAFKRKVKAKQIEPKDWIVPPELKNAYQPEDAKTTRSARNTGMLEERVLDRIGLCLYMSEKEVASVAFPLADGRFDYFGFTATDEQTHRWCADLFSYYWERAQMRASLVEELHAWIKKNPRAVDALKKISGGYETKKNETELIPELEGKGLVKKGELTLLGELVYSRITGQPVGGSL